jgi:hypothetical protein
LGIHGDLATGEKAVAIHVQDAVGRFCIHGQTLIEPKFRPCQILAHRQGQRLSKPENNNSGEFWTETEWQNTVALMNSAINKPNSSLWLRLLIAFGCYLIIATAIFALLNRFSSPTAMPKLLAVIITNGTIFGLPFVIYYFALRRREAFQKRSLFLVASCIGLTFLSFLGLMIWFFVLTFGF